MKLLRGILLWLCVLVLFDSISISPSADATKDEKSYYEILGTHNFAGQNDIIKAYNGKLHQFNSRSLHDPKFKKDIKEVADGKSRLNQSP